MTDQELLKAIAEARGKSRFVHEDRPLTDPTQWNPLSFIADARPLLVELLREGFQPMWDPITETYLWGKHEPPGTGYRFFAKLTEDKDFEKCTCLAWLEMWRARNDHS